MDNNDNNKDKKRRKPNYLLRYWPELVLASSLSFMLLIYAPLELYITNQAEIWLSPKQLIPYLLLLFAVALALCLLFLMLGRRLGRRIGAVCFALLLGLFAASYIQGNFLVAGLPSPDGTAVFWDEYPLQRIASALLWLGTAALLPLALKYIGIERLRKYGAPACAAVCLILAITLITLFATTRQSDKGALVVTDKDELLFSEDENFIVLILDSLDGVEFSREAEKYPEYMEIFRDFTYFDNTVSGYPFTKLSIPFILSGRWYEADMWYDDYVADALDASPLINALEERDYKIGLYCGENLYLPQERFSGRFVNVLSDKPYVGSHLGLCKIIAKMTIIKYAPWELKYLGYDLPGRLKESKVFDPDCGYSYYNWLDDKFYNRLADEGLGLENGSCFKFIHLEGVHTPYIYDRELNITDNSSYQDMLGGAMLLTDRFLGALRESGVYDNAVIVVMADHGFGDGGEFPTDWQHPVLFIKGKGERHAPAVSSAPISHEDLQQAFLRLLDGKASDEVFDWQEGDARSRRFMKVHWENVDYIEEYVQTGRAEDMESLVPTGRIFMR